LKRLGYRTVGRSQGRHLDPLIRESEWHWTGDYYAPDLPIPVDLHFRLWDADLERLTGPDESAIWDRSEAAATRSMGQRRQLCLPDTLTFAALHLLMHTLHGDLRLQRAWEIAFFLQGHQDDKFWLEWSALYPQEVLRLPVVMFCLCAEWFGCALPPVLERQVNELPKPVRTWLCEFGWSPVEALFRGNKHELWLHLALLQTRRDKMYVCLRRLLPVHALAPPDGVPEDVQKSVAARLGRAIERFRRRAPHHLISLLEMALGAVRWWWICQISSSERVTPSLSDR
jgi:hypothetical protein